MPVCTSRSEIGRGSARRRQCHHLRRAGVGERARGATDRASGRPVHVIGGALLAAELDAERAIREGATLAATDMSDNDSAQMGSDPIFRWICRSDERRGKMGTDPSIRVSARARRLSMRVYPDARVEVVVPRARAAARGGAIRRRAPGVDRDAARRPRCATGRRPSHFRPTVIEFAVAGERWRLHVAGGAGRLRSGSCERRRCDAACCASRGAAQPNGTAHGVARAGCCAPRGERLEPRVAALSARDRRALFEGRHPPAAFALGKLFGARYHQPQCLPAVPAPGSGRLPHRARAHARETHESLGALLGRRWKRIAPDWRALDRELVQGWRHVPRWVFRRTE